MGTEQDWEKIEKKQFAVWKSKVTTAAEKRNIDRLREECESKSKGETRSRTKTKHVLETIDSQTYHRKPDSFITRHQFILYTRALIMGRYGMLKCAGNYSMGCGTKICDVCGILDNESHRINTCTKWQQMNFCNSSEKIDFNDIYSSDNDKCLTIVNIMI